MLIERKEIQLVTDYRIMRIGLCGILIGFIGMILTVSHLIKLERMQDTVRTAPVFSPLIKGIGLGADQINKTYVMLTPSNRYYMIDRSDIFVPLGTGHIARPIILNTSLIITGILIILLSTRKGICHDIAGLISVPYIVFAIALLGLTLILLTSEPPDGYFEVMTRFYYQKQLP